MKSWSLKNEYQNDMVRACYITKMMIGWFVGSRDVLDGEREKKIIIKVNVQTYKVQVWVK